MSKKKTGAGKETGPADHAVFDRARGLLPPDLVQQLIDKLGPILAQFLLNWLLAKHQAEGGGTVPAEVARMGLADARKFLAMLLRGNKDQILGVLVQELNDLYDRMVDSIETA